MAKRKTVGALAIQCANDSTKYKAREIGQEMVEDKSIENGLIECVKIHNPIFDMDDYCVGYVIASDPLIKGVMRRKFFAMPYLPSPRPEQAVFLYNKRSDKFTHFLWCLPASHSSNPDAWTMEKLYQTTNVPKEYLRMKAWSHAFYDLCFWEFIRHHNKIDMLSESEYLKVNREEFAKAGEKTSPTAGSEAFDFGKVRVEHIEDTTTARTE